MAEVGVLELQIHDDAEAAAKGLNDLVGALKDVKTAITGVDLATYAEGIQKLKKQGEGLSNTETALNSLASGLQAVKTKSTNMKLSAADKISNLVAALKSNTKAPEQLTKLATAFEKMKQATTGTTIKSITEAMTKLIDAMKTSNEAVNDSVKGAGAGVKDVVTDTVKETKSSLEQTKGDLEKYEQDFKEIVTETTPGKLPPNLGQFGGKKDYISNASEELKKYEDQFKEVESTVERGRFKVNLQQLGGWQDRSASGSSIQSLMDAMNELKEAAKNSTPLGTFAKNLTTLAEAIQNSQGVTKTLSSLATAFGKLKENTTDLSLFGLQRIEKLLPKLTNNPSAPEVLKELAKAMGQFNKAMASSEGSGANSIEQLVAAASNLSAVASGGQASGMGGFATAAAEARDVIVQMTEEEVRAQARANDITTAVQGIREMVEQTRASILMMGDQMKLAVLAAQAMSGIPGMPGYSNPALPAAEDYIIGEGTVSEISEAADGIGDATTRIAGYMMDAETAAQQSTEGISDAFVDAMSSIDTSSRESIAAAFGRLMSLKEQYIQRMNELQVEAQRESGSSSDFQMSQEFYELDDKVQSINSKLKELGAILRNTIPSSAAEATEAVEKMARSTAQKVVYIQNLNGPGTIRLDTEEYVKQKQAELADQMKAKAESLPRVFGNAKESSQALIAKQLGLGDTSAFKENLTDLADEFVNTHDKAALLQIEVDELKQKLQHGLKFGTMESTEIAKTTSRIQDLTRKIEEYKSASQKSKSATDTLKEGINKLFKPITKLISQFTRIAKYRALRYILRSITSGINEGLENVYYYSKAVGTDFASSMDSAATSMAQFKNSIGASLTPVLTALIPIFNTIVNWAITAINYINQLFSLITGASTWTRAIATATSAYDDNADSARAASNAAKDLLADWDELNIIQSSNSSSGSGSDDATDYTKMFEEVSEYDNKLKALIENIKEQFGDVWGLVKKIAAALLGWKVASAFSGFISTLGGLISAGAIIALTFDVVTALDKTFLQTGDAGFLVADLVATLIGAALTKTVLSKILEGKLASIAIPLVFTVSAAASIITLIKDNDTSALSENSLKLSALSALKMGTAAAYLAHTVGRYTLGKSLAGGAVAALFTFGAVMNIKATVQSIKSGVTEETVKTVALGSLAMGIGGGVLAKLSGASLLGSGIFGLATAASAAMLTLGAVLGIQTSIGIVKSGVTFDNIKTAALSSLSLGVGLATVTKMITGVSWAQAGIFGGALSASAILFTLGAAVGIRATTVAAESGITEEVIQDNLISSLSMGSAATIVGKMLTGAAWEEALAGGAGIAAITMGALIGIEATTQVSKEHAITQEALVDDIVSSALIGTGIGVVAAGFIGLTAGAAVTVGGIATIAAFGALIGIQTIVASQDEEPVKWGDLQATQDEIDAFIENKVFKTSASAVLQVVDPLIQVVRSDESDLTASVGEIRVLAKKISFDFNTDDSLKELETKIFGDGTEGGEKGLIAKFKDTAKDKQTLIETGITLVPVPGAGTNGEAKSIIDEASDAWTMLTGHMDTLGRSLSEHLATAYSEGIDDNTRKMELQTISELTNMIANVNAAITQGENWAKAQQMLEQNLSNLSKGSWTALIESIGSYKEDLKKSFETTYDATTQEIAGIMFGLQATMDNILAMNGGDTSDKEYQAYKDEYDRITAIYSQRIAGRDQAIKDAADGAMDEHTKELIRKALEAVMGEDVVGTKEISTVTSQFDEEFRQNFINSLLGGDQQEVQDTIQRYLRDMIGFGFGDSANEILGALDQDILKLSDLITKEAVEELGKAFGVNEESTQEVKDKWAALINSIFNPEDQQEIQTETEIHNIITQTEEYKPANIIGEENIQNPVQETVEETSSVIETANDAAKTGNYLTLDAMTFDTTDAQENAGKAASAIEDMVSRIRTAFTSLNGMSFTFSAGSEVLSGIISTVIPEVKPMATGGVIRSGDLIMANENGNIEMMGKMGNNAVVANNQQIVSGIAMGVEQANSGVEGRLSTIESLLTRVLNKEFVAKAVPSASWGKHATQSSSLYSKVTG